MSSMSSAYATLHDSSAPLYQDKWCCLDRDKLIVYNSFERLGANHSVPISAIKWIATARELGYGKWSFKGWGIGLSPVTWAWDMNRSPILPNSKPNTDKAIVMAVEGSWFKIGFTCEDPENLFKELQNFVPGIQ